MEETKIVSFNISNKGKICEDKREKNKKRVVAENWTFHTDKYLYDNQINMIKNIHINGYKYSDDVSKIALQQITKKIYGYKQQDIIKKHFNDTEFITINSIIDKMVECELKCHYCSEPMNILYDISREAKQWSVDRIDNDKGHNLNNYFLACLECNLKRRRRNDDKFLFTKQLKLIKKEDL